MTAGSTREESTVRRAGSPAGIRWWRRPWVLPLAVVCAAFLAFSLPPYTSLDPADSRIELRAGIGVHYWAVVAHILFGTIALVTVCLQVWPWFRSRYPRVHRYVGRVYVLAGVLPAGALGFVVSALHTGGVGAQVGNLLLNVLWVATALFGLREARRRRFGEHRTWMIRSFALCTSIVVNRVWVFVLLMIAAPQLDSTYAGNEQAMEQTAIGAAVWASWIVNLLVAEWWIQYRGTRTTGVRRRSASDRVPG